MSVFDTVTGVADNVTSVVRLIVLLIMGCIALFFVFGYFAADSAIEGITETVEKHAERRAEAEERAIREMTLAEGDWGSGAAVSPDDRGFADDRSEDDGWGSPN